MAKKGSALPILLGAGALLLFATSGKKRSSSPNVAAPVPLPAIEYEEIVTGPSDPNAALPMVIMFHGRGSNPENLIKFAEQIGQPARVIMPQGFEQIGPQNFKWWDEKSIGDQQLLSEQMNFAVDEIAPFVAGMPSQRPTIGQPIVAGHSQGGLMAAAIAMKYPSLVKRAVAASAYVTPDFWAQPSAPIMFVHGETDRTVPAQRTVDMVQALQQNGQPVEVTVIPNHGHALSGGLRDRWISEIDAAIAA